MNPILGAVLKGAAQAVGQKLDEAAEKMRDRALPIEQRLTYAEGLARTIANSAGPFGLTLTALADLLAEAREG